MKTLICNVKGFFKTFLKRQNVLFLVLPVIALLAVTLFFSATTDKGKPFIAEHAKFINNNDSIAKKPNVDIKVNREYDENGNMIRYDSSYSYSYSSTNIDDEELKNFFNNWDFKYTSPFNNKFFDDFMNYDPFKDTKSFDPNAFGYELGKTFFDQLELLHKRDSLFLKEFVQHGIFVP